MNKTFKSDALAAIHETASDLQEAGLVDRRTMREFDKLCLTPAVRLSADEIKAIREDARVSQRVFAHYLNVSPGIVSQWERGEKHPAGASLKLLAIVRKRGLAAVA
jgi:putative transcriptional regulator